MLGAGAMYLWDPQQGRRRRALLLDQINSLGHSIPQALEVAWRDLANRAEGTVAELRHLVESDDVSDAVLCQRVRSKAGRYVSHPSALEVDAADGCVVLSGPVLAHEVDDLLCAVQSVRGVCSVENHLEVRESPGSYAPLQGGRQPAGEPSEMWQRNWTPAVRLLAGSAGALMITSCARSRSLVAPVWGLAGFALLTRAIANQDWGSMFGVAGGRRAIDIRKTIEIDAPVEKVYDFFSDLTNYLLISDTIVELHHLGNDRFAKEMSVGGVRIHFEERITRKVPGELLESRSEPGSALAYMKQFRLEKSGGGTRLNIFFSYNPPGGVVAHAVAGVLGFDPKTLLDDLLVRAKSYLETGKSPHDATGKKQAASSSAPSRSQPPAAADVWTSGRQ
jgi:uncharacterized membrane protein